MILIYRFVTILLICSCVIFILAINRLPNLSSYKELIHIKSQVIRKYRISESYKRQRYDSLIFKGTNNPVTENITKEIKRLFHFQDSANSLLAKIIKSKHSVDSAQLYLSKFNEYILEFDASQPPKLQVCRDFIFNPTISFPESKLPKYSFVKLEAESIELVAIILGSNLDDYVYFIRAHYVT